VLHSWRLIPLATGGTTMRSFFALLLLLLGCGLSPNAPAAAQVLRLHGSNTIGERLAPALVDAWLRESQATVQQRRIGEVEVDISTMGAGSNLTVEIRAHGSSTAFSALAAGAADIGMSSRPVSAAEVERLRDLLGPLDVVPQEVVLALDGLAIIVHPGNPLLELDVNEVRGIFAGTIRNWSAFGLPAGAIELHARDDRSGTWDSFRSLVLGDTPLSPSARRYESTDALAAAVAASPGAIGFVGLVGAADVKTLAVSSGGAALPPSRDLVAVEDYALSRRLYLYMPRDPTPLARDFIGFALGDRGQAVVERFGFVSQDIRAYTPAPRSDMPEEYRQLTHDAQRLSLNFRFGNASHLLDSKAVRDLDRLAALLQGEDLRQRELLVIGFADSSEVMPIQALALSNDRADYIAGLLIERGLRPARVRGLGGAAPVAANDSIAGRLRNRRVEIWLR
jgi:phosphate transport system substrate-binding protein